jgi:hypothetical protein
MWSRTSSHCGHDEPDPTGNRCACVAMAENDYAMFLPITRMIILQLEAAAAAAGAARLQPADDGESPMVQLVAARLQETAPRLSVRRKWMHPQVCK